MVEIRTILKELKKEQYTVFMSSHLLNEVQEVCDHVALIDHGKLLANGAVSELLQNKGCRILEVRFLQPVEEPLIKRVSALSGVQGVERVGANTISIEMKGREEEQAELLDNVRGLGPRISSFSESGNPLEALYMSLVKESR